MDIKGFPKDFEKRYGYDENIDYIQERKLLNKFLQEGNKQGIDTLSTKHGGIIALLAKCTYQIEKQKIAAMDKELIIKDQIWANMTVKQKTDALQQAKDKICTPPVGMSKEMWNFCTHYFKDKGLARAGHIEGGEVEGIQLTDMGEVLLCQMRSHSNKTENTQNLPKELDTDEAKGYFKKAVELGLMSENYRWLKGWQMLACFAREMSLRMQLGKGVNSDGSQRISWKPFETLFNLPVGKLRSNYNDIQKTGQNPSGIRMIDKVFE